MSTEEKTMLSLLALSFAALVGLMVWAYQQPTCEEQGGVERQTGAYYLVGKVMLPEKECVLP